MSTFWQSIIAASLCLLAGAYLAFRAYRAFTKRAGNCGGCQSCPSNENAVGAKIKTLVPLEVGTPERVD